MEESVHVTRSRATRQSSGRYETHIKGKWQQKILLSYMKETAKQYMEVDYKIFISVFFGEIF